eukprot:10068513-Heterocapsa_arctica.AAC.1
MFVVYFLVPVLLRLNIGLSFVGNYWRFVWNSTATSRRSEIMLCLRFYPHVPVCGAPVHPEPKFGEGTKTRTGT